MGDSHDAPVAHSGSVSANPLLCPNDYENLIAQLPSPRESSSNCVTEEHGQSRAQEMPPAPPRRVIPKDRFAQLFGTLKTQTYHDPAARGPGSHGYEASSIFFLTKLLNIILVVWQIYVSLADLNSHVLIALSASIRTLAWNPTGLLIATGSADRTLRIWNPDRPHVKYSTELRGHSSGIEKVVFNPVRESELASCSSDGTVRFWDVRSKTCVGRVD